jgi:hypothetical protein
MNELVFHPSTHSFASDAEYHGWLQNVWTRKGRAKNKLKRAKRKRKRGRTKAAERLERRAGILKAKASGTAGRLHPGSPYDQLWSAKFPWAQRQRMGGSGLAGAAQGFRPSRGQVRSEWRGTILGGLMALKAAGIEGFEDVDVESLPQKMKQGKEKDKQLTRAVAKATGKKRKGLKGSSGEIRRQVIENGLEEVAWPARALPMLGASVKRNGIMGASAGAASVGLKMSASVVAGTGLAPPWLQNIATAPAALILAGLSFVADGLSAGAAVKKTIAKSKGQKYQQEFVAALEDWGFEKQKAAIQEQARQAKAKAAFQEDVVRKVGEIRGKNIANTITVLAVAGGISFALVTGGAVVGHLRNRA